MISSPWKRVADDNTANGHLTTVFAWVAGLIVSLAVNAAVPFLGMPTMGQAVWATSFAQSIANQDLLALTSNNAGLPLPAPIAFGLPAVYPMAILIRMGIPTYDAYTLVFALWFVIAYIGAARFAISFGASQARAAVLTTLWLCTPLVWGHAGYSMLSLGIALLPTYLLAARRVSEHTVAPHSFLLRAGCMYIAAIIAVFMDGYTFVMFAMGAAILVASNGDPRHRGQRMVMLRSTVVCASGFAIAFLLYRAFMGSASFWIPPIEGFRNNGVDVSFLIAPTRGTSWLADSAGLSVARPDEDWYGDRSVWQTTFLLPLICAALLCIIKVKPIPRRSLAIGGILILVGLYMALGPSLKAWSYRPAGTSAAASMPESETHGPTGSAWLSQHVPGLNNMRAAYRWTVLAGAGAWFLIVVCQGRTRRRSTDRVMLAAMLGAIAIYVPPPKTHWLDARDYRARFRALHDDLDKAFLSSIQPGEQIVFLPHGNDFLAAYLAARYQFRTYNIGGDKNIARASVTWPTALARQAEGQFAADNGRDIRQLLLEGDVDAIVVPYFSEANAVHRWPCKVAGQGPFDPLDPKTDSQDCPAAMRQRLVPVLAAIAGDPQLQVTDHGGMSIIRLRPEDATAARREAQHFDLLERMYPYPINFTQHYDDISWLMPAGWNGKEADRVWSTGRASLALPVPADCAANRCTAVLTFQVYAASPHHAKHIYFTADNGKRPLVSEIATDARTFDVRLPLPNGPQVAKFGVMAPDATSPFKRGESGDGRELGIGLLRIELSRD